MILDAGVETYSRNTFSAQRYKIWTMRSANHSLPTVYGVMQNAGRVFRARDVQYTAEAGLATWRCSLKLNRGRSIELNE